MTTPDDMRAAAQRIRSDDTINITPAFLNLVADWLHQCAHNWDTLRTAADQVIDADDPTQAHAAFILRSGPYDATTARAITRLILDT